MKDLLIKTLPAIVLLVILGGVLVALDDFGQSRYDAGYASAKAAGDKATAELREKYAVEKLAAADAQTAAAIQANALLRNEQARGNQLATQLADAKETLRKTTDTLTREVTRVTTLYRRTLDSPPEPLPPGVFTAGFVRVWNTANGIDTSMPAQSNSSATGRTTTSPDGPRAADSLDSGVTQSRVLANQIRNGELHGSCRSQLNRLIDWTLNGSK